MQIPFLSLKAITEKYSSEIHAAVQRVVDSGWYLQGNENMTFEENMKELSEIVGQLESGELPLEKAVELYEKGKAISASCKEQLENAKLKITEQ